MPQQRRRKTQRRRNNKKKRTHRKSIRLHRGGAEEEPPLTYSPSNGSPITVFMFATERKESLDSLLRSLQNHKYAYEVIGFGTQWGGWQKRLEAYRDASMRLAEGKGPNPKATGPDSVAIFIDAYDMVCIKDADKVYKTYMERPRKQLPIVYAAEWVCYSNCSQNIMKWHDKYKVNGLTGDVITAGLTPGDAGSIKYKTPVFLNAGFLCGTVGKLNEYFPMLLSGPLYDDQVAIGDWVGNNLDKELVDINIEETLVRINLERDKRTNETGGEEGPAFIHFTGMSGDPIKLKEYFAMYGA